MATDNRRLCCTRCPPTPGLGAVVWPGRFQGDLRVTGIPGGGIIGPKFRPAFDVPVSSQDAESRFGSGRTAGLGAVGRVVRRDFGDVGLAGSRSKRLLRFALSQSRAIQNAIAAGNVDAAVSAALANPNLAPSGANPQQVQALLQNPQNATAALTLIQRALTPASQLSTAPPPPKMIDFSALMKQGGTAASPLPAAPPPATVPTPTPAGLAPPPPQPVTPAYPGDQDQGRERTDRERPQRSPSDYYIPPAAETPSGGDVMGGGGQTPSSSLPPSPMVTTGSDAAGGVKIQIGPDGKAQIVDQSGKPVALGPTGKPLVGPDGKPMTREQAARGSSGGVFGLPTPVVAIGAVGIGYFAWRWLRG